MGELLRRIPVNVVVNERVGLIGAAVSAWETPPTHENGANAP
jgi:glucokinase